MAQLLIKGKHTPLMLASLHNHIAIVQMLIGAGAAINARNSVGDTPLILATHKESVQALLKAGADPKVIGELGYSPVVGAFVFKTDHRVIKMLIEAWPASVNQYVARCTPLIYAVSCKNRALTKFLIQAGADIDQPDVKYKNTAAEWADSQHDHKHVLLLIFAGAVPDRRLINYERYMPVYDRVFTLAKQVFDPQDTSSLQEIKALAKKYVFIDPIDAMGNTPLHYAVFAGNRVMLTLLLHLMAQAQRAASATHKNKQGYTPVELAVVTSPYWILPILRKAAHPNTNNVLYTLDEPAPCVSTCICS